MIEGAAFALAYAGFAALALAMNRHHRLVWARAASRPMQRLLRAVGAVGLAGSLTVCIHHAGWTVGPVLWFGMLSAAGIAVVLSLAFRAHADARTAPRSGDR